MTKNRIAELRIEKELSQHQLAKAVGTSQANISRWESGTAIPNVIDCWILATFFDVSIDFLIGKDSTLY